MTAPMSVLVAHASRRTEDFDLRGYGAAVVGSAAYAGQLPLPVRDPRGTG